MMAMGIAPPVGSPCRCISSRISAREQMVEVIR